MNILDLYTGISTKVDTWEELKDVGMEYLIIH